MVLHFHASCVRSGGFAEDPKLTNPTKIKSGKQTTPNTERKTPNLELVGSSLQHLSQRRNRNEVFTRSNEFTIATNDSIPRLYGTWGSYPPSIVRPDNNNNNINDDEIGTTRTNSRKGMDVGCHFIIHLRRRSEEHTGRMETCHEVLCRKRTIFVPLRSWTKRLRSTQGVHGGTLQEQG